MKNVIESIMTKFERKKLEKIRKFKNRHARTLPLKVNSLNDGEKEFEVEINYHEGFVRVVNYELRANLMMDIDSWNTLFQILKKEGIV